MNSCIKTCIFGLVLTPSVLVGCGGGGGGGSADPNKVLTDGIVFQNGTVVAGKPPAPTLNAGDPSLTPPANASEPFGAGDSGSLDVTFSDIPSGSDFDVNVRFGDTANSYVSIPISGTITQGATAGNLQIPFQLPSNICDNIEDIEHQIQCFESVDVGNGTMVSPEVAQQMLLACDTGGDFATGAGDYCTDDYPQESCSILNDQSNIQTSFITGATCASAFPNSEYLAVGGCAGTGLTCGACAVDVSGLAKPSGKQLEEAIYSQLMEYQNNPEARRKIRFIPLEN